MSYWEEAQGQTQNMGDLVQLDELDKVARVRDFRALVLRLPPHNPNPLLSLWYCEVKYSVSQHSLYLHNGCELVTHNV